MVRSRAFSRLLVLPLSLLLLLLTSVLLVSAYRTTDYALQLSQETKESTQVAVTSEQVNENSILAKSKNQTASQQPLDPRVPVKANPSVETTVNDQTTSTQRTTPTFPGANESKVSSTQGVLQGARKQSIPGERLTDKDEKEENEVEKESSEREDDNDDDKEKKEKKKEKVKEKKRKEKKEEKDDDKEEDDDDKEKKDKEKEKKRLKEKKRKEKKGGKHDDKDDDDDDKEKEGKGKEEEKEKEKGGGKEGKPSTEKAQTEAGNHISSSPVEMSYGVGTSGKPSDLKGSENAEQARTSTTFAHSMFATLAISAQSTEQKLKSEDTTSSTVGMQIAVASNLSTSSVKMSDNKGSSAEPTIFTSSQNAVDENADQALESIQVTPSMANEKTVSPSGIGHSKVVGALDAAADVSEEHTTTSALAYSMPGTPNMPAHSTENRMTLQSNDTTPSIVGGQTDTVSDGPVELSDATRPTVESSEMAVSKKANKDTSLSTAAHLIPATLKDSAQSTEGSLTLKSEDGSLSTVGVVTKTGDHLATSPATFSPGLGSTIGPIGTTGSGSAKQAIASTTVAHSMLTTPTTSGHPKEENLTLDDITSSTEEGQRGATVKISGIPVKMSEGMATSVQPTDIEASKSAEEGSGSTPVLSGMLTTPEISEQSAEQSLKSDDITSSAKSVQTEVADQTSAIPVEISDGMGTSIEPTDTAVSEKAEQAQASTPVVISMQTTPTLSQQPTEQSLKSDDATFNTKKVQTEEANQTSSIPIKVSDDMETSIEPSDLAVSVIADQAKASTPVVIQILTTPTTSAQSAAQSLKSDDIPPSMMKVQTEVADHTSAIPIEVSDDKGTSTEPVDLAVPEKSQQAQASTPVVRAMLTTPAIAMQSTEPKMNPEDSIPSTGKVHTVTAVDISTIAVPLSDDTEKSVEPTDVKVSEIADQNQASTPVVSSILITPILSGQLTEQGLKSDDITLNTKKVETGAADHSSAIPVEVSDDMRTTVGPIDLAVTEKAGQGQASTPVLSAMLTTPAISAQSTEQKIKSDDITSSSKNVQTEAAVYLPTIPVELSDSTEKSIGSTDLVGSETTEDAQGSTKIADSMLPPQPISEQLAVQSLKSEDTTSSAVKVQTKAPVEISTIPVELSGDRGTLGELTDLTISENAEEVEVSTTVDHFMFPTLPSSEESTEQKLLSADVTPSSLEVQTQEVDQTSAIPIEVSNDMRTSVLPTDLAVSEITDKIQASTPVESAMLPTPEISGQPTEQTLKSDDSTPSTEEGQREATVGISAIPVELSNDTGKSVEPTEEAQASTKVADSMLPTQQSTTQSRKSVDITPSPLKAQTEEADQTSVNPIEVSNDRGTSVGSTDFTGSGSTAAASVTPSIVYTVSGTPTMPAPSTENSVSLQFKSGMIDGQADATGTTSAGPVDAVASTVESIEVRMSEVATSSPLGAHSMPATLTVSTDSTEQSLALKSVDGSVDGLTKAEDHLSVSPVAFSQGLEYGIGQSVSRSVLDTAADFSEALTTAPTGAPKAHTMALAVSGRITVSQSPVAKENEGSEKTPALGNGGTTFTVSGTLTVSQSPAANENEIGQKTSALGERNGITAYTEVTP